MLEFAQTTKNDLDVDLSYIWSVTRNKSSSDLLSSVLIKNSTEDFDNKIVYEGYDMENSSNTVKIQ